MKPRASLQWNSTTDAHVEQDHVLLLRENICSGDTTTAAVMMMMMMRWQNGRNIGD